MLPKKRLSTMGVLLLLVLGSGAVWMPGLQALAAEGAAQGTPAQPMDSALSESDNAAACREVKALLEQQKTQMGRELGQLKREMALLREDLGKPGVKEIFSGIGYILGLAGMALFVHCRRTSK
jgi:nickel transport protein